MRGADWLVVLLWVGLLAPPDPVRAEPDEVARLRETIERLEARVGELEAGEETREREKLRAAAHPPVDATASWTEDVRLGGAAKISRLSGGDDTPYDAEPFQVYDARLFVDALIADQTSLGGRTLFESASLSFEFELIRLGMSFNRVGDLYVDFRGLGGQRALNVQAGRFQVPYGEYYLHWSQNYANEAFISNSVSLLWWWDEGIKLFGSDPTGTVGYVASLTNGEDLFQGESDPDKQWTLKLFANPTEFLHLSASVMQTGNLGSSSETGFSAIWFGEGWVRPFGNGSGVDNYVDGAITPDGGSEIDDVIAWGADAILDFPEAAKLWLAGGRIEIRDGADRLYDRDLWYWQGQLVLEGGLLSRRLAPFYLALRAAGIGTYDADEGYLLDFRHASTVGYNMQSLEAYSVALGWPLRPGLVLRAEYTLQDIDLVRGVPDSVKDDARRSDFYGVEIGVAF